MRWEITNTMNGSHYWKLQESELEATLRYNNDAHSIRLNTSDKRLFFLERVGMLQPKMMLETEYSVMIGESYFNKNRSNGVMIVNEQKFNFTITREEIHFYDRQKQMLAELTIPKVNDLELYEFTALTFASVLTSMELRRAYELHIF